MEARNELKRKFEAHQEKRSKKWVRFFRSSARKENEMDHISLRFASKRNRRTQIHIRILFQVLQRLKNQYLFLLFHSIASPYRLFDLLVNVIGVRIFSILDSGLKFSGKN